MVSVLDSAATYTGEDLYRIHVHDWRTKDHTPYAVRGRSRLLHERLAILIGVPVDEMLPGIRETLLYRDAYQCPEDLLVHLAHLYGLELPETLTFPEARHVLASLGLLRRFRGTALGIEVAIQAFAGLFPRVIGSWDYLYPTPVVRLTSEAAPGETSLYGFVPGSLAGEAAPLQVGEVIGAHLPGGSACPIYVSAVTVDGAVEGTDRWRVDLSSAPSYRLPIGTHLVVPGPGRGPLDEPQAGRTLNTTGILTWLPGADEVPGEPYELSSQAPGWDIPLGQRPYIDHVPVEYLEPEPAQSVQDLAEWAGDVMKPGGVTLVHTYLSGNPDRVWMPAWHVPGDLPAG